MPVKKVVNGVYDRYVKAQGMAKQRLIAASYGEPGCLAGDTMLVERRQARHTRSVLLRDFYLKQNGLMTVGTRRDLSQPTYLQSLSDTDELFYNEVLGVVESGVKPLVRVSFDDGRTLRVTPDHPVLTSMGFVEAQSLTASHRILGRGTCQPPPRQAQGRTKKRDPRRVIVNLKYHPYGSVHYVTPENERTRTIKTYSYVRVPRARLIVEAIANGLSYAAFVEILQTDESKASRLRYLPDGYDVHHRDENPANDAVNNLAVLTSAEHSRLHSQTRKITSYLEMQKVRRVSQVVSQPAEMTYDVQMRAPVHNFCAEDVVVHNSGKTSFWLGAPGPIVFMSFDQGLEGVVQKYQDEKDIYVAEYEWAPTEDLSQDAAIELRDKFTEDFEYALKHAKTVVWDREDDIWELFRYAEFGSPNDAPRNYPALNQRYRRLINMPKPLDINFGLIQGMKDEWGSKVNKKTGAQGAASTGNRIRKGFSEIDGLVHINLEHRRKKQVDDDGTITTVFEIEVGKARGPGGQDVQDQTFQDLNFQSFASLVFPGTDPDVDWV